MVASQILRVPFMSTPLFYVPDILLAVSMGLIALGIANPWYSREKKVRQEEPPQVVPLTE